VFVWKRPLLLLAVLACGCAQGFDRGALQERLNDGTLQSPDAAIAEARGLRPQLRFPCRIAVYFKPPQDRTWHWTTEDKAALDGCAAALKKEGIAADVFPLPELVINKNDSKLDMKDLRLAAAKCGADALFVVYGAAQTDSYKNFAMVLDLTVVGGFIVPASHRDSLFLIEGVLLDVDNGYIYTGVQAESEGKIVRPTFLIEDKDAVAKAKTKAVTQFGEDLLKRMRVLATVPPVQYPIGRASDVPPVKPMSNLVPAPSGPGPQVPINAGGVMTGPTAPEPVR